MFHMLDRNNNKIEVGDTIAFCGPHGNEMCVGEVSAIKPRRDWTGRYYGERGSERFAYWVHADLITPCQNTGRTSRKVGDTINILILKKREEVKASERLDSEL